MRQKEGFVLRNVCGQMAVFAEGLKIMDFGKMVTMNDTAVWIWNKCAELGDFAAEQLAEAITEEYNVEPSKAQADINNILNEWKELGMIE